MTSKCQFEIEGKIKGKGRPRFSNLGKFVNTYTPADTASYENLIKLQFRISCGDWYLKIKKNRINRTTINITLNMETITGLSAVSTA